MNNLRRAHLTRISDKLAELKEEVQVILDLEQEAFHNLPVPPLDIDRANQMAVAIDDLDQAIYCFEELAGYLAGARGEV